MRTVKDGDLQRLSLSGWGMHLDLGGLGFYHLMINKIISALVVRGFWGFGAQQIRRRLSGQALLRRV